MAKTFPGAFAGYKMRVVESHQATKKDTSGTAKAVVQSFVELGIPFEVEQIELVREPEAQIRDMKVGAVHVMVGMCMCVFIDCVCVCVPKPSAAYGKLELDAFICVRVLLSTPPYCVCRCLQTLSTGTRSIPTSWCRPTDP